MSIRILYGPKKKALTEIFINEINESIKKNHKYRLIVVIPEQFSSYYEEQLASGKGFMKVEVMTFSRLMQRFFDLRYIDCDELINDTGKTMLLYSLLNKDDMRLEFYNKSKTYPGFSVLAKQTIDELRANNISYEDIRNISQKDNISESSRKKFFEISKIYEGYVTILKDSGLNDQTDLYDMLCEHIKNTSAFDNSIIWFDRFAFFSSKEFDVIKAFMKKAERINISLCMDYRMKRPDNDLFTIPQTTMDKIKKEAKTQNINIIEENDYSFMDARGNLKTLEVLFDNLFRSKYEKSNQVPDAIEVFKAYDIYEEVEYAAIRIMNAVKNRGLRFKDILCVASDVTSYERVIKAVFDQYDIPYYINSKKILAENPIIKFIISILDIYIWDYDISSISRFIKNMYSFINENDAFKLENYIIKWGISKKKAWNTVWNYEDNAYDEKMNRIRAEITDFLNPFFEKIKYGCSPKEFAVCLYELIQISGIYEKTSNNENYTDSDGAEQARQCFNSFIDILDQLVIMTANSKKPVEYYNNIIKTAIMEASIGITPVTKDCVFLTTAARTDIRDYDTVIILGVNEGMFPSVNESKSLFNDSEIEKIRENGYEITNDPELSAIKEEYQIYELMQSPKNRLHLSYHANSIDGSDSFISVWLSKILEIFPQLKTITRIDIPSYEYAHNIKTAFPFLFPSKSDIQTVFKDTEFEKLLNISSDTSNLTSKDISELIFGGSLILSPTMLEQYVKCPYSFLMSYGLKLEERKEFEYFSSNLGSMKHSILFNVMSRIDKDNLNYTYDEIYRLCEESADLNGKTQNIYKRDSILEYVKKRAIQQASETIKISLDIMKNEKMRPKYLEAKFDESSDIRPLELNVNGNKVKVTGKVDRIDTADTSGLEFFRVIDYKTSDNNVALYRIKEGHDIQLALYAYAYYKSTDAKLAGMYYMTIEHEYSEVENSKDKSYMDNNKVLPGYTFDDGTNRIYQLIDEKNIRKSKIVSTEIQNKIYESIEKTIISSAENILKGRFEVLPIKDKDTTACKYCPYGILCGFDSRKDSYRKIESLKDNEVQW